MKLELELSDGCELMRRLDHLERSDGEHLSIWRAFSEACDDLFSGTASARPGEATLYY